MIFPILYLNRLDKKYLNTELNMEILLNTPIDEKIIMNIFINTINKDQNIVDIKI